MCSSYMTCTLGIDLFFFVFFFQAEDGIRDHCVTGVQTCALPICRSSRPAPEEEVTSEAGCPEPLAARLCASGAVALLRGERSEERRVGKECRSRWAADR